MTTLALAPDEGERRAHFDEAASERFWSKVDRRAQDECWPWLGTRSERGYGSLRLNGKMMKAHRIALSLHLDRDLVPGAFACHTCDHPWCVNPSHLWEGTCAENNGDRHRKGRTKLARCPLEKFARGERHGRTSLNAEKVRAIRASSEKQVVLANRYGVSGPTIRRVRNREVWAHV